MGTFLLIWFSCGIIVTLSAVIFDIYTQKHVIYDFYDLRLMCILVVCGVISFIFILLFIIDEWGWVKSRIKNGGSLDE